MKIEEKPNPENDIEEYLREALEAIAMHRLESTEYFLRKALEKVAS